MLNGKDLIEQGWPEERVIGIALAAAKELRASGLEEDQVLRDLEAVMNSIKNCLGMRKTWVAKTIGRPWNSRFYGDFIQVHNTL